MSSELNRQLYLLWGKEIADATVELAGNQRIRPTAVQHAGVIIEMEKAIAENKHPLKIAEQVKMNERTVRTHRDSKGKRNKK